MQAAFGAQLSGDHFGEQVIADDPDGADHGRHDAPVRIPDRCAHHDHRLALTAVPQRGADGRNALVDHLAEKLAGRKVEGLFAVELRPVSQHRTLGRDHHQSAAEHAVLRRALGNELVEASRPGQPLRFDGARRFGKHRQSFPGRNFKAAGDLLHPGKLVCGQRGFELAAHFVFQLERHHHHRADEQYGGE